MKDFTNDLAELQIQLYYFQKKAKENKVVKDFPKRSEKDPKKDTVKKKAGNVKFFKVSLFALYLFASMFCNYIYCLPT